MKKAFIRLCVLGLALWGCGLLMAASTIDRTIAKINDDILTESDLAEIVADVAGDFNPLHRAGLEGATSETVKSMFDRALLLQEARRMRINPPSEELHRQVEQMVREIRGNFYSETEFHHALAAERISLDQLKKDLLEKTEIDYMVFHVVNSRYSVSDEEVARFKQEQLSSGEEVASFRLRRLGIPVKANGGPDAACREARALVARIITDGISFEEGVRRYSLVPGAASDGGDMGYLSADKLTAEIRTAVENLEEGEASAPVIAGGYANVFYMEGRRGARSALREQRFFEARKELLENLRRKAILQVFDQRLMKIMPDVYKAAMEGSASAETQTEQTNHSTGNAEQRYPAQAESQQPYQQQPQPQHANQPVQQHYHTHPQYPQAQPTPQPRRRGPFNWFGGRR